MSTRHSLYSLVLIVLFLLQSCRTEDIEPKRTNTFSGIFDSFWIKMNQNYLYWDVDDTNWDNIYRVYKSKFDVLNINDKNDILTAVTYFEEMTQRLIDGHFEISFINDEISHITINPLFSRKQKSDTLYSFSYLPFDTIYLDSGFKLGYDRVNMKFNTPLISLCGLIDDQVIYFSCNYFGLTNSFYKDEGGEISVTLNYLFNLLSEPNRKFKGLILDVRGNPGGDLIDLNFLLGNLINEPLHIGYSQYKRGYGRLEYTNWIGAYINPNNTNIPDIPIVVLADRNSASLSEGLVLSVQAMPKGIFLGETTWGALGPLIDHEIYIGGSFEVENFMKVRTSTCKVKSIDHMIYESVGIYPDVFVPHSIAAYSEGVDIQLEKALELLLK